jgi:hypothetical protein
VPRFGITGEPLFAAFLIGDLGRVLAEDHPVEALLSHRSAAPFGVRASWPPRQSNATADDGRMSFRHQVATSGRHGHSRTCRSGALRPRSHRRPWPRQ